MTDEATSHRSLESFKREAKRWLAALQRHDSDARARFTNAHPAAASAPPVPTLRDVQLALAREQGFAGWTDLKAAVERRTNNRALALAAYEEMAQALLEAYRTGTPEAMERHYALTWHRRAWKAMRSYVLLDLGISPPDNDDVDITLADARYLVAVEHGFRDWDTLKRVAELPRSGVAARRLLSDASLMTSIDPDAASLDLSGAAQLTDDGVLQLTRLGQLRELNLSNTAITDRALAVLESLPLLETLSLAGTRVSDAGAAKLASLPHLRTLNLAWTHTGDGALRALSGKTALRELHTGALVSDAGIALLHDIPAFKEWKGGEVQVALLSYRALPNHLTLRGTFTDRGMQQMRGLDGLFGLNVDDARLAITAAALEPLGTLPHLGWLAVDAKDDWMPPIARMPALRFLAAQDTTAGDAGFGALAESQTIEYLWGRRSHNLRTRGFRALARMPRLRALAVSCLNVEDEGIAALPDFPALRELMPMDVPDAGYRHIGGCRELTSLILMYCRDTTDAATEQITALSKLTDYFNSYTTVTDRTPHLLSAMPSLERITFDTCHRLTNAGIAELARLPRLRELRVSGRGITPDVASAFGSAVAVHVG